MADYTHWTEQVYALNAPTNWAEVTNVIAICDRLVEASYVEASYEDSVTVDVVDTTGEGDYQIQFRLKVKAPQ